MTRTRRCDSPAPANGGTCLGRHSETKNCNKKKCRKFFLATSLEFYNISCQIVVEILRIQVIISWWIACGRKTKDALPPKMTSYCKKQNSCARLARQGKCRKKFKQSIYRYCKRKLPHVQLNAYVKNYCRKSCKNCVGTFIVLKKCHLVS